MTTRPSFSEYRPCRLMYWNKSPPAQRSRTNFTTHSPVKKEAIQHKLQIQKSSSSFQQKRRVNWRVIGSSCSSSSSSNTTSLCCRLSVKVQAASNDETPPLSRSPLKQISLGGNRTEQLLITILVVRNSLIQHPNHVRMRISQYIHDRDLLL